jgi:hypothetical protein
MVLNGRVIAEKIKLTTNAYRITIPARIDQKRFTPIGYACRKPGADSAEYRVISYSGWSNSP